MKKIILILSFTFLGVQFSNAQSDLMSLEVHAGMPTGDLADLADYSIGVNLTSYFVNVAEIFQFGGRAGYSTFKFSDDGSENFDFVTVAATGKLLFYQNFFARLDLGYAIGISDNTEGALFYEPRIGYNLGAVDLSAYYQSITEDANSVDSIGVGIAYKF